MQRKRLRERIGRRGFETGDVGAAGVGGEEAIVTAEASGVAHLRVATVEVERREFAGQRVIEPVAAEADFVIPQSFGPVSERIGGRADARIDINAAGFVAARERREDELVRVQVVLERDLTAEHCVVEDGVKRNLGIEGFARSTVARLRAASVEIDPLAPEADDEARLRREIVSDLAEKRGVVGAVASAEAPEVVRVGIRVRAGFAGVGEKGTQSPAIDPAERAAGECGIETEFLVENGAIAIQVTETLIRSGGPVVVVSVAGFHPARARDGREARPLHAGKGGAQAGRAGPLVVAARLVAGRELPVIIQGERVITVAQFGKQKRAVETHHRRGIRGEPETGVKFVAGVRVAVERDVAAEAVAVALVDRDAGHEPLRIARRERTADRPAALTERIATGARLDPAGPIRRGRVGQQADDTARGVGAKCPSLRSAQDLHLANIKGPAERAETREVEIIDEKAHRGIGRLTFELRIFPDATNLEIPRTRRSPGKS